MRCGLPDTSIFPSTDMSQYANITLNSMNNSARVSFSVIFFTRITASLLEIEKATAVNEVVVASSVSVAHSAPDQTSENDEGFVEPKHHFFKKKVTYEVSSST